jgi:hypothetical protein
MQTVQLSWLYASDQPPSITKVSNPYGSRNLAIFSAIAIAAVSFMFCLYASQLLNPRGGIFDARVTVETHKNSKARMLRCRIDDGVNIRPGSRAGTWLFALLGGSSKSHRMSSSLDGCGTELVAFEEEVEELHKRVEIDCSVVLKLGETKNRLAQINGNLDRLQSKIDSVVVSSSGGMEVAHGSEIADKEGFAPQRAKKRGLSDRIEKLVLRIEETAQFALQTAKTAANAKKEEGNVAFKNAENAKAIRKYSEAVALDNSNPVYLSNRSACHQKMVG